MPTNATLIQHIIGNHSHRDQTRLKNNNKEEIKPPLFAGSMILYTENPIYSSTHKKIRTIK